MSIATSAQPAPIVPVSVGLQLTDQKGLITGNGKQALQGLRNYVVNMCRTFPCNATALSNVITLTLLSVQPEVRQYASYDAFAFVAPSDSTGAVSAKVVTETGTLATLKVYLNNGNQAGAGAIKANALYRFYYNDALSGGDGGFVIDGNAAATLVALTDSSGGGASNIIASVSGTGADTAINNNFASLSAKINAVMSAIGTS